MRNIRGYIGWFIIDKLIELKNQDDCQRQLLIRNAIFKRMQNKQSKEQSYTSKILQEKFQKNHNFIL